MTDRKSPQRSDPPLEDTVLDALFDAVRSNSPEPSGDALARWVTDAEAFADSYARPVVGETPQPSWLRDFWETLGGWRGGVGLATIAVAGVLIGVNPPEVVDGLVGLAAADESFLVDVVPSLSDFGLEG